MTIIIKKNNEVLLKGLLNEIKSLEKLLDAMNEAIKNGYAGQGYKDISLALDKKTLEYLKLKNEVL